jgi:hypothetical protein
VNAVAVSCCLLFVCSYICLYRQIEREERDMERKRGKGMHLGV